MPRRRKHKSIPHEPGKLPMSIKLKMEDNQHFTDLVVFLTAYSINHAMSPSDLIDASLATIHQLELFSYRIIQKGMDDDK